MGLTVRSLASTIRRWWPPITWIGVIFGLSTIPGPTLQKVGFSVPDKVAHTAEYAVLGALLTRALAGGFGGRAAASLGWAVLVASLVGLADEVYQMGIPGRESSAGDWLADVVGASIGSSLCGAIINRSSRGSARKEVR